MNDLSHESAQTAMDLLQKVMAKTWITESPSRREVPRKPQISALPVLLVTGVLVAMLTVVLSRKPLGGRGNENK